jgi:hypothetical protein
MTRVQPSRRNTSMNYLEDFADHFLKLVPFFSRHVAFQRRRDLEESYTRPHSNIAPVVIRRHNTQ